jgi:hypothetical protein
MLTVAYLFFFTSLRNQHRGLGVACWLLVPNFAGSNPPKAVGILRKKKILSTTSFGGEVKPSVACCRFTACKRSLNGVEFDISAKLPDNILAHSSTFHCYVLSRRCGRRCTWRRKLERLKTGKAIALPLRTCPRCSIPEPYRSPD